MIANFAACDRENYGDLLYPIILNFFLKKYGESRTAQAYAFFEGDAPGESGYFVSNINDFLCSSSSSSLIIGGGDCIRTDKKVLASHYGHLFTDQFENKSQPFAWLNNVLGRKKDFTGEFINKYMAYTELLPYALDPTCYTGVKNVIYSSVGVPFKFHDHEKLAIKEIFDNSSFIYVRDDLSMKKLIDTGIEKEIHSAPDIIVAMSDFFDKDVERKKGLNILESYNINTNKEIICFQCAPLSSNNYKSVLKNLIELKKVKNAEIILLPIGYCHDDHIALSYLSKISDQKLKYISERSIFDIISIIAASNLFIGTSMHGNITAFSFGIPHLTAPIGVDKIDGFLNIVDLDSRSKLESYNELIPKAQEICKLGSDYITTKSMNAKKKVHDVLELLCQQIK